VSAVLSIEFSVPYPPTELSPNTTSHWAKKSRKVRDYRRRVRTALASQAGHPFDSVAVHSATLTIDIEAHPKTARKRDHDNLVASLKAALDELAHHLQVDDSRFRVGEVAFADPTRNPRVIFTVHCSL
jgi:crossover junction endodeoxyribonuclease RusA